MYSGRDLQERVCQEVKCITHHIYITSLRTRKVPDSSTGQSRGVKTRIRMPYNYHPEDRATPTEVPANFRRLKLYWLGRLSASPGNCSSPKERSNLRVGRFHRRRNIMNIQLVFMRLVTCEECISTRIHTHTHTHTLYVHVFLFYNGSRVLLSAISGSNYVKSSVPSPM